MSEKKLFFRVCFLGNKSNTTIPILRHIWKKICNDKVVEILFYDGSIKSEKDFLAFMTRDNCLPFFLLCDSEVVGFAWVNNFEGKMARIHLTSFKNFFALKRRAPHFAEKVIKHILTRHDKNGYLIDTLVGITPITNRLAVHFSEKSGMKRLGILPNGAVLHYEDNKVVDAVVTYATRETMGGVYKGTEGLVAWYE